MKNGECEIQEKYLEIYGNSLKYNHVSVPMKFYVRVTPSAREDGVEPAQDQEHLRVWVTEPPIQGRANAAVLKAVAEYLGVVPSRLRIISGRTARSKVIGLDE